LTISIDQTRCALVVVFMCYGTLEIVCNIIIIIIMVDSFIVVTSLVTSTKLLYTESGLYLDGWPTRYVSSHPGQLSLAIPPWVGAISTRESWDVNRHTARCTGPISVVSQCKNWCLAEDYGNGDQCCPI